MLDDPNGTPWLMQAYSLIVDPSLTYDDLKTLDKKLKLPAGWKYRFKVLDKDLEGWRDQRHRAHRSGQSGRDL